MYPCHLCYLCHNATNRTIAITGLEIVWMLRKFGSSVIHGLDTKYALRCRINALFVDIRFLDFHLLIML